MRNRLLTAFLAVIFALAFLAGCGTQQAKLSLSAAQRPSAPAAAGQPEPLKQASQTPDVSSQSAPGQPDFRGELKAHFLDVGQADSILVQLPGGKNMLVDAGNNADGGFVVDYLRRAGVKKLDYLVGTHPHEDHIGGLDDVLRAFDVGNVYMPRATSNTKTYEDVLRAVQAKGLKIATARAGVVPVDGSGLNVSMLAPVGSGYEDLNNYSAVLKVVFGQTAFLLAGDAEDVSEGEMLASGADLKADVLKVGHHGSASSTTPAFLKAVSPKYAIISVGKGNDYGHPAPETLQRLQRANVKVFRTDRDGTLLFASDGNKISVQTSRLRHGDGQEATAQPVQQVSGKVGEKIYHLPGDPWYDRTKAEAWFKTEEEAKATGFRPPKR